MTGYLGMDLPRFVALVRQRAWLIAGIVGAASIIERRPATRQLRLGVEKIEITTI